MASIAAIGEDVSVGRVIGRGVEVIVDNPLTVFVIAFAGVVPSVAANWYEQTWRMEMLERSQAFGYLGVTLGALFVRLAIETLVAGSLVRATLAHSRGERATLVECLQASLRVALPLIGLSLLQGVAIILGSMFLVVPGVILYLAWSVAAPALVAERTGVTDAMVRSWHLTEGARWKVFGVQAIVIVGGSLFTGAFLATLYASTGFNVSALSTTGLPLAWIVGSTLSGALLMAVASTIRASLYVELRNWKEGLPGQSLAEIFA